jgi:rSAM/selenodomain-associated transferase 1
MILAPIGLGLMCKPPRPGFSKTRLAASIGAQAAARLSRAFLEDAAYSAQDAACRAGIEFQAFFRPADARREIAAILGPQWPLAFADAGDLGATMIEALGACLERCPAGAMIIGADVPLMGADILAEAAACLRRSDPSGLVIVPSVDGGYCLLGVRSLETAATLCAPMEWSTPTVLDETLRRASAANLTVRLFPPQRDIDDRAGLDWLRGQPGALAGVAPHTCAVLAELDEALGGFTPP